MAITDINISEELQTNAPSIKYRGNEGPKSPQEKEQMMMASLQEEYQKYVFEMKEQGVRPMSLREFIQRAIAEGQMSGGRPVLPNRQMAAYGGIMGVDGRRQYGVGSKLKRAVRKIIPNEVAKVAEVAAPFVAMAAPQFALPAAIAGGLGSFDRTGSITSGLKSGALTYGLGALSPGVPGLRDMGPQGSMFTTQPFDGRYNISNLFAPKSEVTGASGVDKRLFTQGDKLAIGSDGLTEVPAGETFKSITNLGKTISENPISKTLKTIKDFALDNKLITGLVAGTLGASALMGNMEPEEIQDLQRGEGLDVESIRAEVIEAFKDPSGEKLKAIRSKYPFLGKKDTKDLTNLAEGGRIGFAGGGIGPVLDVQEDDLNITDFMQDQGIPFGQMASNIQNDAILEKLYEEYLELGFSPADAAKKAKEAFDNMSMKQQPERVMAQEGGDIEKLERALRKDDIQGLAAFDNLSALEFNELIEKLQDKKIKQIKQKELDSIYDMGRIGAQEGGIMDLGGMEKDYRNTGGFVDLGAKEKADDVPARLSVNEFVMTADAVRGAGGGDIDKGAEIMENVMKNLEKGGTISEESQGLQGAQEMFNVSERLSEVV